MDKRNCIHCGRQIDESARLCLYCNRYQHERPIERAAAPIPAPDHRPARRKNNRALYAAAAVVILLATMVVGALVVAMLGRDDSTPARQTSVSKLPDKLQPAFIPVPEADPTSTIGSTVTPEPVPDPDHQPIATGADVTAATSDEYARILQAQAAVHPAAQIMDPRTLTGTPVVSVEAPRPKPRPETQHRSDVQLASASRNVHRTRPEPIYQPVPAIEREIDKGGMMRFVLTVGPDGRVKEVEVLQTIPGKTTKVLSSIQKWRFEPATVNGRPVSAEFPVDIAFNPVKRG